MKKLLCIALILCFLPFVAIADDINTFTAAWNSYAPQYGAPTLTSDMVKDGWFVGDGWKLGGDISTGVVIYAKDAERLLPMAAQAGMIFVGDYTADELIDYLGNITLMYLNGKSSPAFFGSHVFFIKKEDDQYTFIIQ